MRVSGWQPHAPPCTPSPWGSSGAQSRGACRVAGFWGAPASLPGPKGCGTGRVDWAPGLGRGLRPCSTVGGPPHRGREDTAAVARWAWGLPAQQSAVWTEPGVGPRRPGHKAGSVMTPRDLGQGLTPGDDPTPTDSNWTPQLEGQPGGAFGFPRAAPRRRDGGGALGLALLGGGQCRSAKQSPRPRHRASGSGLGTPGRPVWGWGRGEGWGGQGLGLLERCLGPHL